jgi:hypothetical protein
MASLIQQVFTAKMINGVLAGVTAFSFIRYLLCKRGAGIFFHH